MAKGWSIVVIFCGFLGMAAGYSSAYLYTAGLFLLPMAKQFEISRGAASLGPLFCALTAAAIAPVLGRLLDRFGALTVALSSLAGLSCGFVLLAVGSHDLQSYVLLSVMLAVLGSGSTGLSFSRLVLDACGRHRGIALGIVMSGTGFGALVLPPLVMPAIQEAGWRAAYLWLAAVPLGAAAILATILVPIRRLLRSARTRTDVAAATISTTQASLWPDRSFQALCAMFFLMALASVSLVVHFVPVLVGTGTSAVAAAKVAGLIGLASIGGRLLVGSLLDRLPTNLLGMSTVVTAMLSTGMLLVDPALLGVPAAVLLGIVMGAESDLLPFYVESNFPRHRYGAAFGGILACFLVGAALGPTLVAYLFDFTAGYSVPLLAIMAMFVLALVLALRFPGSMREIR